MRDRELFDHEKLELLISSDSPKKSDPDSLVNKYTSGEIRIVTEQGRTQLPELPGILESDRYLLKPEYQRRRRWSAEKQSRLVESFLMNVPIPPIFLYEYQYAKYEVMDGLQRLTALWDFYKGDLHLTGLEYWSELEGMSYFELPDALRQGIDRRYLSSIVLLYETARDDQQARRLKQLVFERINSGGVELSYQESRNAVSNGPLNERLQVLARTSSFCKAWNIPEPDGHEIESNYKIVRKEVLDDPRYQNMEDVEMVLRFFAHRQRTAVGPLRNLRNFLDTYWIKANQNYSDELVESIGSLFVRTSDLAYGVLGDSAFYIRRERGGYRAWVPRPTLIAYDAVMAAFSRHVENSEKLLEEKELVGSKLTDLYDQNAAAFDGRRTDPQDVQRRDELISGMLNRVIARR